MRSTSASALARLSTSSPACELPSSSKSAQASSSAKLAAAVGSMSARSCWSSLLNFASRKRTLESTAAPLSLAQPFGKGASSALRNSAWRANFAGPAPNENPAAAGLPPLAPPSTTGVIPVGMATPALALWSVIGRWLGKSSERFRGGGEICVCTCACGAPSRSKHSLTCSSVITASARLKLSSARITPASSAWPAETLGIT
mmetsp:Transcript_13492/g.36379  ORF Transcript_13492/g.36379 Transcript_13492/m.36379 type:complete len:202 (+) Transcript_13492:375-980(+)